MHLGLLDTCTHVYTNKNNLMYIRVQILDYGGYLFFVSDESVFYIYTIFITVFVIIFFFLTCRDRQLQWSFEQLLDWITVLQTSPQP